MALALTCSLLRAAPPGTGFMYQGRLAAEGTAAQGTYDLRFTLYDASSAGTQVGPVLTNAAVAVSGGLFTTAIDFGASPFTGEQRWLEVAVRTNGDGAFVSLTPRQPLTPTVYALYALTPAGPQGPVGPAGVTGPQGPAGATGAQGPRGLTWRGPWNSSSNYVADDAVQSGGSAWLAQQANSNVMPSGGAQWTLLAQKGDLGPQGPQGVTGPQGPIGATGPQGPAGATGATGPQGPQGVQGPAGSTGAQGPRGLTWRGAWNSSSNYVADDAVQYGGSAWLARLGNSNAMPSEGAQWTLLAQKGDAGAQGPQGLTGPQGPIGATGPQGPTGATGATGPQGAQGVQGPAGATGAQGPRGLTWRGAWNSSSNYVADDVVQYGGSAWLAWLDNSSITPSEGAQWTLLAQKGDIGPQGPQGLTGPQGPIGATGAAGPQGPNTTTNNTLYIGSDQNGTQSGSKVSIGTDNQPVITILESGNVGIGTNQPQTSLHVVGTARADAFTGNGAGLTGLNAAELSGTIAPANIGAGTISTPLTLNNSANSFMGNGSGLTSLNASQLSTGTVVDTRLSANVALLNGAQTFTGAKTFTENMRLTDKTLYLRQGADFYHGLGWYATGSFAGANPDGPVLFGNGGGGLGYTGGGTTNLALAWYSTGGVAINPANSNDGSLQPGLTFGNGSGEGISSKRTAGANQYGLDFYTASNLRMTIANNGNVGIGKNNPATSLDVNGTVRATSFSGGGSVPSGGMLLSSNVSDPNLQAVGYVKLGRVELADLWEQRAASSLAGREGHTAVWTGTEMIVWGGTYYDGTSRFLNDGARYNPAANSWTTISTTGAPARRHQHTAVWTGSEMIIWGGYDGTNRLSNGGRYNPAANSWTAVATAGAPSARNGHTAVWTGSEMIIWGGQDGTNYLNNGARYNPIANTWTAVAAAGAPVGRSQHTALWTGSEMIIWGGDDGGYLFGDSLKDGGRYNPAANSWTPVTTAGAPIGRYSHTAVWTGSEMIVWGGRGLNGTSWGTMNSGGRYNPAANSWSAMATSGQPRQREFHTAVWTGAEMIVWGGQDLAELSDGGRYNPAANIWLNMAITGAAARRYHAAVWTGTEMIIWGGSGSTYLNDTFSYTPTRGLYLYQRP